MQFSKAFQLQYRFEEIQKLKFVVVDVDDKSKIDEIARHDMIGELECALADLVTAGQQYERTLRLNGEWFTAACGPWRNTKSYICSFYSACSVNF